ncbi:MAG: hypothetical protein IT265_04760 [Saprospiraceae bacterium]|nr:hypothetical protein [Saprospiraceae bacterium]
MNTNLNSSISQFLNSRLIGNRFGPLLKSSLLLFFLFYYPILEKTFTQNMPCGLDSTYVPFDTLQTNNGCIDVQEILDELDNGGNCRLIWINVNVHFFVLNSNLNDLIVPSGMKAKDANKLAEDLIIDANYQFELNPIQKNQSGSIKICNPFRYVLKGVYIHQIADINQAQARPQSRLTQLGITFGINETNEFNLFISPCSGCSGIAEGFGLNFINFNVSDLRGQTLNHEFGHLMDLGHSFEQDGIADTPPLVFDLDRNCDGILSTQNEKGFQCWNKIMAGTPPDPGNDQIGMNFSNGKYSNGINDCEETSPCPTSPCCLDQWINNNAMAYNAEQNSFTYLQLKQMLEVLLDYKCDYINIIQTETNSSCLTPNAFISDPLPGTNNIYPCSGCFDLSASVNEDKHKIRIYKITNGTEQLVYDSGWKNVKATKICYNNFQQVPIGTNSIYLSSNSNYRLELTVGRFNCDAIHTSSRLFTTGDCPPNAAYPNSNPGDMDISPNPTSSYLNINFDLQASDQFTLFAFNPLTNQYIELFNSTVISNSGAGNINVSVDQLTSGTYALILIGTEHIYSKSFIKL